MFGKIRDADVLCEAGSDEIFHGAPDGWDGCTLVDHGAGLVRFESD